MAKFYKSRYTAAQQDALLDIVEQGGSGGEGESDYIYTNISDKDYVEALLMFATLAYVRDSGHTLIITPIYVTSTIDNAYTKIVGMSFDLSLTIMESGIICTIRDFLDMVDMMPIVESHKITKEQFYSL